MTLCGRFTQLLCVGPFPSPVKRQTLDSWKNETAFIDHVIDVPTIRFVIDWIIRSLLFSLSIREQLMGGQQRQLPATPPQEICDSP